MTGLLLLLPIALAVVGVLCVLSGAVQITWDGLHQRAKRKRTSKT